MKNNSRATKKILDQFQKIKELYNKTEHHKMLKNQCTKNTTPSENDSK